MICTLHMSHFYWGQMWVGTPKMKSRYHRTTHKNNKNWWIWHVTSLVLSKYFSTKWCRKNWTIVEMAWSMLKGKGLPYGAVHRKRKKQKTRLATPELSAINRNFISCRSCWRTMRLLRMALSRCTKLFP